MQMIEITKGAMKGQTFKLIDEYTTKDDVEMCYFDYSGDGRIVRRIKMVNVKKI